MIHDVLIVCSGNMCRSPLAAAELRRALLEAGVRGTRVHSAGTVASAGVAASEPAIEVAEHEGLDISYHRSTPLSQDLIHRSDLVVVMEKEHLNEVLRLAPEAGGKSILLSEFAAGAERGKDVTDPYGASYVFYEQIFFYMKPMLARLARWLSGQEPKD